MRDVSVSILPQAVNSAVGFATSIALARGLGAAGMGTYSLVISISTALLTLSDLGIGHTAVRFASHAVAQGNKIAQYAVLRRALRWRLSTAALVLPRRLSGRAVHTGTDMAHPRADAPDPAQPPNCDFRGIGPAPIFYFQSMKQFARNAVVQCMQALINFAGILLLGWLNKWSVEAIILTSIISSAIGAAVFLGLVRGDAVGSSPETVSMVRGYRAAAPPHDERLDNTSMETFAVYMVASSILVTLILRADLWLMGDLLACGSDWPLYGRQKFSMPLMIILGGAQYGALAQGFWE